MGRITDGKVLYGETRKIAEFESKKAEVAFTFTFDDGEDYDTIFAGIREQAKHQVQVMLGLAKAEPVKPAKAKKVEEVEEPADEPVEAPKAKRGRPKTVKAPVETAEEPAEDAVEEVSEEVEEVEETAEDDLSDLEGEGAVQIADTDLTAAIAKRKAELVKAGDDDCGVKIRKLIGKYATKIPLIPQDKRADFIEKLKALK